MKKVLTTIYVLLAIASFIYGAMILSVASGTKFFLVWFLIAALFLILALATSKEVFEKIPKVFRRLLIGIMVALMVFFIIVQVKIAGAFSMEAENDLDYIMVLGAQVKEDGPSLVLKYRLDKAIEYLEASPRTKCIVTGGKGANEPFDEAQGMADYLVSKGVNIDRIILENKALNTKQNIQYSKKLMEDGARVAIVSNDFHMYRAMEIAKAEGLEGAQGISADSVKLYLPNNMLREFFGLLKFWIL